MWPMFAKIIGVVNFWDIFLDTIDSLASIENSFGTITPIGRFAIVVSPIDSQSQFFAI